ncbi:rhodanese-like domain-containing protein [Aneurinibacillus terranovensis]|uniref:rhodanese-like domain-containing protein n=1 Tax=Aneurinibacillus terranovensis TaxID=278991 RepID=UPI00040DB735|nr:rhodanese-like domain-containing protein [Aneurinibacillus terranovensis]
MEWINYVLLALVLWFIIQRILPQKGLKNLAANEVQDRLTQSKRYSFIDVREVHEYTRGHISGFKNIPLSQLKHRIAEIDQSKVVVLTCQSGMRSRQAAKILSKAGFEQLSHLRTGVSGWNGTLVKGSE